MARCQETKTYVSSASRQLAPTWLQTIVVLQRSCGGLHLRQGELPFKEGSKPYEQHKSSRTEIKLMV